MATFRQAVLGDGAYLPQRFSGLLRVVQFECGRALLATQDLELRLELGDRGGHGVVTVLRTGHAFPGLLEAQPDVCGFRFGLT
jgi:hypothetical protein